MSEKIESLESHDKKSSRVYYSIGEVCKLTGVEPYVLRYWESEFPQLKPKKSRGGNRAYREKDINIIKYIKQLLYEEEYTIAGARKKIATLLHTQEEAGVTLQNNELISLVKKELKEILRILKEE